MKYSYSPSAGFQVTPSVGHARAASLSLPPPRPTPPPAAPTQYPAPAPAASYPNPSFLPTPIASPPAMPASPFYGSFAAAQQPQGPPPGYAPPLPPRRPSEASQKPPVANGYTPVSFDSPHPSGLTPEQFYGSLIDSSARPTEILSRMSDASFFWLDQSCDIPGLRGTGVVEPAKYGWLMSKLGTAPEECSAVEQCLESFYTTAAIPFRYVQTPRGQVPVVDRRGWLHLEVWEARAMPQEAFETWTKILARMPLVDPATGAPFPTPFPRGALPLAPEPTLQAQYLAWQTQCVTTIQRQRSEAMVQNIMNAARPAYNPYNFGAGALGGGASAFGANALGGGANAGSGGGGDDSNSNGNGHAGVLDTVNNVATLANTVLGAFGVGGGNAGNAGGAGGAAQLGVTALGALGGGAFGGYGTGYGY
ncbi:hypothetical protein PsYK624_141180 [Phanerochaete sordida]|uniref:DUF7514 domain-containing protein n=1 Tax=Phanerochaete sordida TaxID=48140 RepID=A0A9P3GMU3_9APHY|nr:hypothetical protein PsYK624_141180 [Phanerochaete sordida]